MKKQQKTKHRGSLYQRKTGQWCGEYRKAGITVYGKTLDDARTKLEDAIQQWLASPSQASNNATVSATAEAWLAATSPDLRPYTIRSYRTNLDKHILPSLGAVALGKLTQEQIKRWISSLELASTSVRTVAGVLATLLKWCVGEGLLTKSPMHGLKLPSPARRKGKVLDSGAARAYLEAAKGLSHGCACSLALLTGMRQGEIGGLAWPCVQPDEIRIEKALQRVGKKYRLFPPKTAAGKRSITLSVMARDVLQARKVEQVQERLAIGSEWIDTGLVFTTPWGKPIHRSVLLKAHRRILLAAELPRIRFHDLRHSCATLLLELGESPKVVQEILGHASSSITLDIYSHVSGKMQAKAMDKMDGLLG